MAASMKVGDVFTSYSDFISKLERYKSETGFCFTKSSSKGVESKNKTIKDIPKRYPTEWEYVSVVFTCKHYGQYSSSSKGVRTELSTYRTGCEAILKLSANKQKGGLVITHAVLDHNHAIANGDHKYPQDRRLNEEQLLEMNDLISLNVSTAQIIDRFNRQHGLALMSTDVRNHRYRLAKKCGSSLTEEDLLWQELQGLAGNGTGITIVRDSDDKMSVLFIQTPQMKSAWLQYPQTLFLDSTYKVNSRNMPLFVFMTCDGDNDGVVVAYALVVDEKASTVSCVIDLFVANNDVSSLSSVTIDKDFSELKAVKEKVPQAEIILCKFHVLKTFEERSKKEVRKDEVFTILKDMVNSKSVEHYEQLLCRLVSTASQEFVQYFSLHWNNMASYWAGCHVKHYIHYGNRTNNFVERQNRDIRQL